MVTEPLGPLPEARWRLDRGGPDDHPGHTALERGLDIRDAAGSAAGLHRNVHRRGELADRLEAAPATRSGAVEVNDMQPGSAGGRVSPGQRNGVFLEATDLVEVALTEADRLASQQVDGGEY